ncbi:MAG TPA: YHS domain-containing protein, partial [Desulfobacteraceae bacterium]|nr:YHS domain-containing protein [Desulfobacteraceae bacterium]
VDDMVQDPVCGTYVPLREAYQRVIDGKVHYFCSERCADLFMEQHGRRQS